MERIYRTRSTVAGLGWSVGEALDMGGLPLMVRVAEYSGSRLLWIFKTSGGSVFALLRPRLA